MALSAPGALDPRRHYAQQGGSRGPSDAERKMRLMMGTASSSASSSSSGEEEEEEDAGDETEAMLGSAGTLGAGQDELASAGDTHGMSSAARPSTLASLPIEIVERVLAHAMAPSSRQVSEVARTNEAMRTGIALRQAARLCLVSRQFDALTRPQMYRRIAVAQHRTRALLRTLEAHPPLAAHVRDLTLDSRIWTSDVNEDTVARIFVAVRAYVVSLRVGANESAMLPYLFHGTPPTWPSQQQMPPAPAALQSLHICWRDEVDFDPTRRRRRRPRGAQQPQRDNGNGDQLAERADTDDDSGSGETDDDAVRDTLRGLFQHSAAEGRDEGGSGSDSESQEPDGTTVSATTSRAQEERGPAPVAHMLANLEHLTLDLYTHAQLAQLFLASGYFVQHILPQLRLLRIELPLVVVQFASQVRGSLVAQWPCKRWVLHSRNIHNILDDRIEQNRRASVDHAVAQERRQHAVSLDEQQQKRSDDYGGSSGSGAGDDGGNVVLAPCGAHQLKALLMRYGLNVHKNDMTLFRVLLAPTRALDQGSWSSRAAAAAYCLGATLTRHFAVTDPHPAAEPAAVAAMNSEESGNATQRPYQTPSPYLVFSLANFLAEGAERYWREQWAIAGDIFAAYLPPAAAGADAAAIRGDDSSPWQRSPPRSKRANSGSWDRKDGEVAGTGTGTGTGADAEAVGTVHDTAAGATSPHVAILLKWPAAQDAFFQYSAMV